MQRKITDQAKFDFIRYANCWEDADILLEALNGAENAKILSIASAGDNSLSLLSLNPEQVVAIDINPMQLYLTELKKVAIQEFEYELTLEFLGFASGHKRLEQYRKIRSNLSEPARSYFDANEVLIKNGIIHAGKFEKYFQLFATRVLPLIHTKKRINLLFKEKNNQEQHNFYEEHWNTWRWKLLFKIFFGRKNLGEKGRDPRFMNEVKVNVAEFIYRKAETHLRSTGAQKNYILDYTLRGTFETNLPHYMRKENYALIRKNLPKLVLMKGFAEDAYQKHGKFDRLNLSNIFEYMNSEEFAQVSNSLLRACNKNARLAYWNLMVPRSLAHDESPFKNEEVISGRLSEIDKGFFYDRFIVDTLK